MPRAKYTEIAQRDSKQLWTDALIMARLFQAQAHLPGAKWRENQSEQLWAILYELRKRGEQGRLF